MQGTQEACLVERCTEFPEQIKLMYGWKLLDFCESNGAVYAKVQNVNSEETKYLKGKYLVGCDGPSSRVSQRLEARFDGFVNMGQTRTVHLHAPTLIDKVR
jgi:2-polyprenyl-6-methoxyphenol hydroxylase-like FAD-dependent oxidoreductase